MISSISSSFYNFISVSANHTVSLVKECLPSVFSHVAHQLIKTSLQDQRIGKIVGGLTLFVSGSCLFVQSGIPSQIKSCLKTNAIKQSTLVHHPSTVKRWGFASVGLCAMAYGTYQIASGILELSSENNEKFLVCHDNKPSQDQQLPRFGIVDLTHAKYTEVHLYPDSELAHANDLESLQWVQDNQYIACESKGKCYQFTIDAQDNGSYVANSLKTFKLDCPNKFYNIEGFILKQNENQTDVCWSHRGGIYKGEEPWTRCGQLDLDQEIMTHHTETAVEDPFGIYNELNRATSDHACDSSGKEFLIATIDTEGSKGIAAIKQAAYSILYTHEECIDIFMDRKFEALYVDLDKQKIILATDNDNETAGAEICTYSLQTRNLDCQMLREGQEYGIGGIAPFKI